MKQDLVLQIRKLSQLHAYNSIQLHETVARKAGFSGTDHKYLGFFLQKGKLTAGELSVLTGLTTGAVTGLIDRFEKKKLVKRQPDKNDRRKVYIVPDTEKITALVKPYYEAFQHQTDKLIATFTIEEIKVLEAYFRKAIALISETTKNINNL
ncbi:MarR family transcriptional regulator [Pseudoflavitalea sp. G-6-1-2]|uniref:MarR family winged helix-turn-helix transcriptional regulator n=1 Tax=Pseudoflavitalea sp. G-6-1-2 TaxID=2728841 RepID=UPI001469CB04|nr:MarR family transcriptional regulator [Pseudoflavitalea sp. G-6-1-2]NML21188.1 MarR family transcriptional regulator [Pseudoflavitalea sp. G-6-1-2]